MNFFFFFWYPLFRQVLPPHFQQQQSNRQETPVARNICIRTMWRHGHCDTDCDIVRGDRREFVMLRHDTTPVFPASLNPRHGHSSSPTPPTLPLPLLFFITSLLQHSPLTIELSCVMKGYRMQSSYYHGLSRNVL